MIEEENKKSTHKAEIVRIHLQPHEEADNLSVVNLFGGYTCIVRTADWEEGQLAAYILPDSVVPTDRPEFSFLAKDSDNPKPHRIRVMRLRGKYSMGLLIPAPEGSQEGDDVAEQLGVTRYEPPILYKLYGGTGGDGERPPEGFHPVYDVDSLRRYAYVFKVGELVHITEKIHGANARYCFIGGEMHAGSRTTWKRKDSKVLWWKALEAHPEVEKFCIKYPHLTVYGEVYGQVQDLQYGTGKGEVRIAVFDILNSLTHTWLNPIPAREIGKGLPWVPVIEDEYPFMLEDILNLAEGPSLIRSADHIREGIVVKPMINRSHLDCGRINLKVVSNAYLDKSVQRKVKAKKAKMERAENQSTRHKHNWEVHTFTSFFSKTLAVSCRCGVDGVVEDPTPDEIMEAWEQCHSPYLFKGDYNRIKILVKGKNND
jgi:RNA ligase (TIGR02306 family)